MKLIKSKKLSSLEKLSLAWKRASHDIVVDPIRGIFSASDVVASVNSWGYEHHGISDHYDTILKLAKNKVAVIVLDSSGHFDHEALETAAWNERRINVTGSSDADDVQHGNHVAGTIAGYVPNSDLRIGIAAPLVEKGLLRLIPAKVLENGASSYQILYDGCVEALELSKELISEGYKVVWNMSLGGSGTYIPISRTIEEARELGVFVAAATGNNGQNGVSFPANSDGAYGVGAITQSNSKASFSNYGDDVFATMAGIGIVSSITQDGQDAYISWSGTSMACPHLAAMAAIFMSIYDFENTEHLEEFLIESITDLGSSSFDILYGHGTVMVGDYVEEVEEPEEPEEPVDPEPEPEEEEEGQDYPYTVYFEYLTANLATSDVLKTTISFGVLNQEDRDDFRTILERERSGFFRVAAPSEEIFLLFANQFFGNLITDRDFTLEIETLEYKEKLVQN